jgi:hypothetical protein
VIWIHTKSNLRHVWDPTIQENLRKKGSRVSPKYHVPDRAFSSLKPEFSIQLVWHPILPLITATARNQPSALFAAHCLANRGHPSSLQAGVDCLQARRSYTHPLQVEIIPYTRNEAYAHTPIQEAGNTLPVRYASEKTTAFTSSIKVQGAYTTWVLSMFAQQQTCTLLTRISQYPRGGHYTGSIKQHEKVTTN